MTLRIFIFLLLFSQSPLAKAVEPSEDFPEEKPSVFSRVVDKFKKPEQTSSPLELNQSKQVAPKPFDIEYRVSLNALPTGLKAKATLRKQGNYYLFELFAKNWVLSYDEKSAFIWDENSPCDLKTESYQFTFEGFGHLEAFEISIDQEENIAHSKTRKGDFSYEVPGNVSDALAYLFKLQCDVANNRLNPDYSIAYDDDVDRYIFRYVGTEELRTSLGKLKTIVLERVYQSDKFETTYWIAPELDYLMVRMKHKQGKLVTATLKIKEVDFDIKTEVEIEEQDNE